MTKFQSIRPYSTNVNHNQTSYNITIINHTMANYLYSHHVLVLGSV